MGPESFGSFCFGVVVGWICYRTLRRKEGAALLSDISTVIAALGGGVVTGIFNTAHLFGGYSIGLAVGFFAYLIVSLCLFGSKSVEGWMGS